MKETEKIVKKIEDLSGILDKFYNALDEIYIEDDLDVTLTELSKTEEGKKLTKKQRKEKVLDYLQKKFPNLSKQLDEFNMITEAVMIKVNDAKSKIEDAQSDVEDIEYEKEELERRIDELKI